MLTDIKRYALLAPILNPINKHHVQHVRKVIIVLRDAPIQFCVQVEHIQTRVLQHVRLVLWDGIVQVEINILVKQVIIKIQLDQYRVRFSVHLEVTVHLVHITLFHVLMDIHHHLDLQLVQVVHNVVQVAFV